ncbi:cupin domain-containing protein [Nocardioides dilutus]
MEPISLDALIAELFDRARQAGSGRAAHNLLAGQEHPLSQTVIAILAGHGLGEHESPGEATLQVLRGRVTFTAASGSCDLAAGDFLPLPRERHSVDAFEDSVLLLSVVK